MPQILYGADPSQLAQLQQGYDSLNANANAQNADSYNRAAATAFQAALQQRQQQQAALEGDAATAQTQDFQANQNALDRASRLQDVQTQFAGARQDANIRQNDVDFQDAAKDAMNGALPADAEKLGTLYPHFSESQISQLEQLAGAAKLSQLQSIGDSVTKGGGVIDNSALDQLGLSSGPFYEKAKALVKTLQQPYATEFNQQNQYAQAGNRLAAIKKDLDATPLPTASTPGSWLNPFNWIGKGVDSLPGGSGAVPQSDVIQPNPDATARLGALQSSLAPYVNPAAKNPTVAVGPTGQLVPALPRLPWMGGQSAGIPAAPNVPPPLQRQRGKIYNLPSGAFMWTGTGWVRPQ